MVEDTVSFSRPESFETALITYAQWERHADGSVRIFSGDRSLTVCVESADGELEFSSCVIQESSTPTRLAWHFVGPVRQATVTITVIETA